jgi:hypothetical protein
VRAEFVPPTLAHVRTLNLLSSKSMSYQCQLHLRIGLSFIGRWIIAVRPIRLEGAMK